MVVPGNVAPSTISAKQQPAAAATHDNTGAGEEVAVVERDEIDTNDLADSLVMQLEAKSDSEEESDEEGGGDYSNVACLFTVVIVV